eukprot:446720-Pelagomonas_calceolata.AAC.1
MAARSITVINSTPSGNKHLQLLLTSSKHLRISIPCRTDMGKRRRCINACSTVHCQRNRDKYLDKCQISKLSFHPAVNHPRQHHVSMRVPLSMMFVPANLTSPPRHAHSIARQQAI